ncbi:MAG: 3-deoxy-7-phosphoheptulonate synthase [Marinibacterium sp.]|nr:3-deoxy-7-phosphoheptulonate synthase [Marinibacterium sp.]
MTPQTQNLRIVGMQDLVSPQDLARRIPITDKAAETATQGRSAIQDILHGRSDRLIVVVGPCSIHDPDAALDYARRLRVARVQHADALEIVMRVYFEKPRTIGGWKGLINDPGLDESFRINDGLAIARRLCRSITELDLPVGTEFLDAAVPQYIADLVSWAAIGARTTESQIHREMASGLSCPVGFKNGTRGNLQIALDAVRSAARAHHFMALNDDGRAAIAATAGNPDCHVILRGGAEPNYDAASVQAACAQAERDGIRPQVMVDASHANSAKDHCRQGAVLADLGAQIAGGDQRITGVMIESHLIEGRQNADATPLTYGQSITDACIGWDDTATHLAALADAVRTRRGKAAALSA